jgi:hypothetical protein
VQSEGAVQRHWTRKPTQSNGDGIRSWSDETGRVETEVFPVSYRSMRMLVFICQIFQYHPTSDAGHGAGLVEKDWNVASSGQMRATGDLAISGISSAIVGPNEP